MGLPVPPVLTAGALGAADARQRNQDASRTFVSRQRRETVMRSIFLWLIGIPIPIIILIALFYH